jgi:hypothetical protein
MNTAAPSIPAAKVAYSIAEFIERLDALAVANLPLKGDEATVASRRTTRYYRLEVDGLVESPWVTVFERADRISATVSGDDSIEMRTPEEAFEALRADCRVRLSDAGCEPAF